MFDHIARGMLKGKGLSGYNELRQRIKTMASWKFEKCWKHEDASPWAPWSNNRPQVVGGGQAMTSEGRTRTHAKRALLEGVIKAKITYFSFCIGPF